MRLKHTTIHNYIVMALDNKSGVMLVQLDMSAAYPVDHTLLLACMKSIGAIDVAHQWFESCLSSRSYVCQTQSDPLELLQGVPQGSVLGPILFTLYTRSIWNDLPRIMRKCDSIHQFKIHQDSLIQKSVLLMNFGGPLIVSVDWTVYCFLQDLFIYYF